ncbi:hypothetical protein BS50DRAFT_497298 [Corynespora cassiicola Philippines]|uniref:AA9 family lytic polysaccharide monooxygenase n=1 Tax=Corynespora cassiicola Philippines TaxID=1448308 RepID=A0A2T2NJ89_CORCC|nr:hypothetical protein BS50DRAFT_497298 [Corynespora cassiicola Philippines]
MKSAALLALAAGARLAAAHATVMAIFVNDEDQGMGYPSGYIRTPPNNSPVVDVSSKDMTCNVGGSTAAPKTIEVKGGDKITFEWHHNTRDAADDIIDGSHKGPVLTYIAPADSNGEGDVWLKLAESGYNAGKWAVTQLIEDRGKHSITLPDLAAGEYILRPEIIALHEGNRVGGAQLYMECVQIKVTSSGAVTLPAGVAIPGAYKSNDAGIHFDIYNSFSSYPIPGPKVWDGASGGAAPAPAPAPAPSSVKAETPAPTKPATVKPTSAPAAAPAPAPVTSKAPVVPAPAPQKPTTLVTSTKPKPTQAPSNGNNGGAVEKWGWCGGINYKGSSTCADGWVCKEQNPYYFQCVEKL